MDRRFLCAGQRLHKLPVDLLRQGAVDVIRRPPVVAGGKPGLCHIPALRRDQRRSCVEEVQILSLSKIRRDGVRQRVRRQRPRRDDHRRRRDLGHFAGINGDIRVIADLLRHQPGKAVAVDCQAAASLDPRRLGARQDQAPGPAQLLFQKAHGVFQSVAPEGVGAHQLRKIRAVMCRGHRAGLHLIQRHRKASLGQLPGGLAARQARADYFDRLHAHSCFFFACAAFGFALAAGFLAAFVAGFFAVLAADFAAVFSAALAVSAVLAASSAVVSCFGLRL